MPFSGLAYAPGPDEARRIPPAPGRFRSGPVRARVGISRLVRRMLRDRIHVARVQGGCYLVMGMWPLTHMASLEQVTGPKHDVWLMQTAGALLAIIGVVLILGSARRIMSPIVALLGAGIAGVLALLAAAFVALGHIARIYMLDVALEATFVAWWLVASLWPASRPRRRTRTKNAQRPEAPAMASLRRGITFTAYLTPTQRATRH